MVSEYMLTLEFRFREAANISNELNRENRLKSTFFGSCQIYSQSVGDRAILQILTFRRKGAYLAYKLLSIPNCPIIKIII